MRSRMVCHQECRLRSAVVLFWLALALTGFILSGCGVQPISLPSPLPSPLPLPSPSPPPARDTQPAAGSLLNNAEQALSSGDALKAEGYLERAIRIEPQNPLLWHALARSKFQQDQYPQTIQMSLKSNSFRPDRATEQSNWLLMEKAYRAMGDAQKAENAHAKALE